MKETIYDLLDKIDLKYQFDEELTDVKAGYFYLKIKSDIVNGNFDELKKQFELDNLFIVNLKVLFELTIDYSYSSTFTNNLKEAVSLFIINGRRILKNNSNDENFLEHWELLNELIKESNSIVENDIGKERLIKEELEERWITNNLRNKKFIDNYYGELLEYDYIIYFLYYMYLPDNKESELYEKFNNPYIIKSASDHLLYLNNFVKEYSCEEIYIKLDDLKRFVRKNLEELKK